MFSKAEATENINLKQNPPFVEEPVGKQLVCLRASSPFGGVGRRHARAERDAAVVLETVKNYNLLIRARYVLFLMMKFRPTQ